MQPDYALMSQLLAEAAPAFTPAALHGAMTGFLSSGGDPGSEVFVDLLEQPLTPTVVKLLEKLSADAAARLAAPDFAFELLLPPDESPLSERLRELALWCHWFNTGFAAGFIRPQLQITAEVTELLRDFTQLAGLDDSTAGDVEEDEANYMELVEYVRMGAITIFQQLNPAGNATQDEEDTGPLFADDTDQQYH